jgi:hypothetical protein
MDQTEYVAIRIHPPKDTPCRIEDDFISLSLHLNLEDFIMTYEDDAARPHYHILLKNPLTLFKLKQSFKTYFPYLKGNKAFAFTKITDHESFKNYICKGGKYRLHTKNYTIEDLHSFRDKWLSKKGEIAQQKQDIKKKKAKQVKDLEDQFNKELTEMEQYQITKPTHFPLFLKEFIIKHHILNYNKNFIDKYYRLFLKKIDPERYENYLFELIKDYCQNIM